MLNLWTFFLKNSQLDPQKFIAFDIEATLFSKNIFRPPFNSHPSVSASAGNRNAVFVGVMYQHTSPYYCTLGRDVNFLGGRGGWLSLWCSGDSRGVETLTNCRVVREIDPFLVHYYIIRLWHCHIFPCGAGNNRPKVKGNSSITQLGELGSPIVSCGM